MALLSSTSLLPTILPTVLLTVLSTSHLPLLPASHPPSLPASHPPLLNGLRILMPSLMCMSWCTSSPTGPTSSPYFCAFFHCCLPVAASNPRYPDRPAGHAHTARVNGGSPHKPRRGLWGHCPALGGDRDRSAHAVTAASGRVQWSRFAASSSPGLASASAMRSGIQPGKSARPRPAIAAVAAVIAAVAVVIAAVAVVASRRGGGHRADRRGR